MTAQLIDGTAIAQAVRDEVKVEVAKLKKEHNLMPGLATVLVGENPASKAYVGSKQRACAELGMNSIGHKLPASATQEEVLQALLQRESLDPTVLEQAARVIDDVSSSSSRERLEESLLAYEKSL